LPNRRPSAGQRLVQRPAPLADRRRFFGCVAAVVEWFRLPRSWTETRERMTGKDVYLGSARIRGTVWVPNLRDEQSWERVGLVLETDEAIPVESYLDTNDDQVGSRINTAIVRLVELLGLYVSDAAERKGSIWRRMVAKTRVFVTHEEVASRIDKLEQAAELKILGKQQAEVDALYADKLAELLASLEEVPSACIRIGAFILIKYQTSEGSVVLSRTLGHAEVRALERYPEIQKNPAKAIEALATAVASMEDAEQAL
jgi:hypothetical protein